MRRLSFLLAALSLFTTVGAMGQYVMYNYWQGTDFSKFKTYRWVVPNGPDSLGYAMETELQAAVDGQLAKKGLMRIDSVEADLVMRYDVANSRKTHYASFDIGYGPSLHIPGWYAPQNGGAAVQSPTGHVNQLGVYFTDFNHNLVWHGLAMIEVNENADKQQKNLNRAVAKLFKQFPPPSP